MHGTAVSPMTVLQRADIGSYHTREVLDVTATEGDSHMIRCKPVKCFPEPSFGWALAESGTLDESPKAVVTNRRVQMDDQGMLCYVRPVF